jgi:hypothetical protein
MKDLDVTILSLKRNYSKDELVSHLLKILKEKDFEIGVLKSDISEMKDENTKISTSLNKSARKEVKKEDLYNSISKKNTALKKIIKEYKFKYDILSCKLNTLTTRL